LPNSFSKSAHRAGVSGWKLSFIGSFVTGNLHPGNPECARLDTAVAGVDCTPARKKRRRQGMKRFKFSESVPIVALVCALVGYSRGGYAQEEFVAHLTGQEEVPARATRGQGQAIFQLSDDGGSLDYKLIAANIENVVMAHIHVAAAGVNGPIVVFLFGPVAPGGGRTDRVLAEGTITAGDLIG